MILLVVLPAGLLALGLLIVAAVSAVEAVGRWSGRRQARQLLAADTAPHPIVVDDRRAQHGPPPGLPDRRRRDVGPAGRHRRDDSIAGQTTATGIMRAVRVADDQLPEIPRPTRAQLRQAADR